MKTKILSIITLICIGLVSIIFLWHEEINFNYRLNDEKFGNYATVIGAIATSVALLFLAMQLREMENARTASYKPLLIPQEAKFYTADSQADKYFPSSPEFFLDWDHKFPCSATFKIYNMGKGIARNIDIRWHYDVDAVKKHVEGKYEIPRYFGFPFFQSISFIEESGFSEVDIPLDYLLTCGIQVNNRENPNLRPELTMTLKYQDLHDPQVFQHEFTVFSFSLDGTVTFSFAEKRIGKNYSFSHTGLS